MAELTTLARPYAKAAFQNAQSQKQLAEWSDLLLGTGQIAAHKEIRQLLTNPGMAELAKADLILDCSEQSTSDEMRNFFAILAENHRLALLPEIATLFNTYRADLERTVNVQVSAPFELTDEQQQKLAQALSTRLERQVTLETSLDKSLIGGVIVRTGDMVIDASVRGKLAKMAKALGS